MGWSLNRPKTLRFPVCLVRIVLILIAPIAFPQDGRGECIDYSQFLHWVGGVDTPGTPYDVAVSGSYAYVAGLRGPEAEGFSALDVIAIEDPAAPELVGSVITSGFAYSVAVAGTYAYVIGSQLTVVDISNPRDPVIVESANVTGQRIAVAGNHAYVVAVISS